MLNIIEAYRDKLNRKVEKFYSSEEGLPATEKYTLYDIRKTYNDALREVKEDLDAILKIFGEDGKVTDN